MKIILPHQFDRLSDYHLKNITIDDSFEDRIEAIMCTRNGSTFSDGVFNEMTIDEIFKLINYLSSLREEYKNLLKDVKDLKHFKDSHIGIYSKDKKTTTE